MNCQHCGCESEPNTLDGAALCPECGSSTSDEIDFVSAIDGDFEAPDLAAVDRLLASLQPEDDDLFQFPKAPRPIREERSERRPSPSPPLPQAVEVAQTGSMLGWAFLGLGLMAFTCGAVMLGWSVATNREELWAVGIPMALGGQAAIIFGLIGLLEASSQRQKHLTEVLDDHRRQLALLHGSSDDRSYSRAA